MKFLQKTKSKKIQGSLGDVSFTVVLPKDFATQLGITKKDFLNVSCNEDYIVIEKDES